MSKQGWTPGPWTAQRGTVDFHIWPIGWHKSGMNQQGWDFTPEDYANARLIAAAPEMVEALALHAALEEHDCPPEDTRWKTYRKMREVALRKAKGE